MSVTLAPDPADPDGPPAVTPELARFIADDIQADPGTAADCGPLLASTVRGKFTFTTYLRVLVADLRPELRDSTVMQLVRAALDALASGQVAALDLSLGNLRVYIAGHLSPLGAAALDALELTTGVAAGDGPPWF